jgi:hypothetical protein
MQFWLAVGTALLIGTHAYAQGDASSVMVYAPSCQAAADVVQGKRPAADSLEAAAQLRKAALCFGAMTAIMNLEAIFKPEFAACPPKDKPVSVNQMVLIVVAYLKSHPEQARDNFHQAAVKALATAWPCP